MFKSLYMCQNPSEGIPPEGVERRTKSHQFLPTLKALKLEKSESKRKTHKRKASRKGLQLQKNKSPKAKKLYKNQNSHSSKKLELMTHKRKNHSHSKIDSISKQVEQRLSEMAKELSNLQTIEKDPRIKKKHSKKHSEVIQKKPGKTLKKKIKDCKSMFYTEHSVSYPETHKKRLLKSERSKKIRTLKSPKSVKGPDQAKYDKLKKQKEKLEEITQQLGNLLRANERALNALGSPLEKHTYEEQHDLEGNTDSMKTAATLIQKWWRKLKPTMEIELHSCRQPELSEYPTELSEVKIDEIQSSEFVELFKKAMEDRDKQIEKLDLSEEPSYSYTEEDNQFYGYAEELEENEESDQVISPFIQENTSEFHLKNDVPIPFLNLGAIQVSIDEDDRSFDFSENLTNISSAGDSSYVSSVESEGTIREYEHVQFSFLPQTSPTFELDEEEPTQETSHPVEISETDDYEGSLIKCQIENYLNIVPFKLKPKEVNTGIEPILEILRFLLAELVKEENKILDNINTPQFPDLLGRLFLIQNSKIGELTKVPTLDLILPQTYLELIELTFNKESVVSKKIYLQMIFDCVNEALNYIRPYGVYGVPPPWSKRDVQNMGKNSIEEVVSDVIQYTQKWWNSRIGVIDCFNIPSNEDEQTHANAEDFEKTWEYYEDEEMQAVCDTADDVLKFVLEETITVLGLANNNDKF